ncbi:MAG: hypothetical protein IV100_12610 [Myxococcales bacterium]|nr:hypothetical protein [Myxococcales bacterium]
MWSAEALIAKHLHIDPLRQRELDDTTWCELAGQALWLADREFDVIKNAVAKGMGRAR